MDSLLLKHQVEKLSRSDWKFWSSVGKEMLLIVVYKTVSSAYIITFEDDTVLGRG